jgi:hypothetical protein
MAKTPHDYVKSGDHLPPPLKDFHDAKDVFKVMHRKYGRFEHAGQEVNWVLGNCYVIDWFLWFMAQRGWTLQRSRVRIDFTDLAAEIAQMKEEDAATFLQMLEERKKEREVQ